jgi:hypothetical protein
MQCPLRLTDSELAQVFAAARPLDVRHRDAFLRDVANVLASYSDPGPGDVYRAILAAQRRHFDPPQFNVAALIMDGEHPARVPDQVIARIRAREVSGAVELPKSSGLKLGIR